MWERKAMVPWRGGTPFCGEKTERGERGEIAACEVHTRTLPQNCWLENWEEWIIASFCIQWSSSSQVLTDSVVWGENLWSTFGRGYSRFRNKDPAGTIDGHLTAAPLWPCSCFSGTTGHQAKCCKSVLQRRGAGQRLAWFLRDLEF